MTVDSAPSPAPAPHSGHDTVAAPLHTRRPAISAVHAVLAFIAFTVFTLVGSNAWLAWRGYAKELDLARESSSNLAHAMSQQFNAVFSEVGRTLESIAFKLEQDTMSSAELQALQPELVDLLSRTDHLHSIFVFDKDGRSIVDTQPGRPQLMRNGDRPYFLAHLTSPSTQPLISAPLAGRSTGTWVIPVTRRLNDANGRFAGVVLAAVRVDYVRQMLEGFAIGQRGAAALLLLDGTILVRRPFAIEDLGRNVANTLVTAGIHNARSGTARMVSPIDGEFRLLSFEYTANHPVVVAVARAENEILRDWWRAFAVQAATVVVLSVLLVVSGRYVVRVIRHRSRAEQALQSAHQQVLEANLQLQHLATHDGLTQLLNRRAFDERAAQIVAHCARYQRSVSVVLFDVDYFKAYNDHFGHQPGDECLRAVAQALAGVVQRPGDLLARYGGEEFVMVLPETDAEGARTLAASALQAVRALRIYHPKSPAGIVTVSAGGTTTLCEHPPAPTVTELVERADGALYHVKHDGKNAYREYQEPPYYL